MLSFVLMSAMDNTITSAETIANILFHAIPETMRAVFFGRGGLPPNVGQNLHGTIFTIFWKTKRCGFRKIRIR
jgi:hypothetical protein